ncbi:hypothetical protein ABPG74_018911 [Tetrahymena malaccensis]
MKQIRKILKWDWGKKTYKGFGQSNDEFRGQSAPLWVNSSPIAFLVMAVWGFLLFVVVLIVFITKIDNYTEYSNCSHFKQLIIFEIVIVGLNAVFDFSSYMKRYDTDQGWSRSLIYLTCQCILLGVAILLQILFAISNQYKNCTDNNQQDDSQQLFISSVVISGNIAILLIIKLFILMAFSFRYYYEPNAFLAFAKTRRI